MKRSQSQHLQSWFQRKNRMPLILRGARQVGKSTLVRLFCEEAGLDLLELNLERSRLKSVERDNVTVEEVLDEVQLRTKKNIHNKAIIFFDEIQEQPSLLKFLRYFYEERPEIAIISAGSLLEIALKAENFSFPVGRVEFQYLGPMTFTEFLRATNQNQLADKILNLDLSETVHDLASEEFRKYLYIGGMPQSIKTYIEEKSLISVRAIQEQIIQTYKSDFAKYNKKINFDRIDRIFSATVTEIGRKLIYQRLDSQSQSRDIRRVVELLCDAKVIIPCYHSDGNSITLHGEVDTAVQKIFFLDVGLANCLLRLDLDAIDTEMKSHFNTKGIIAEQFVAQHLAYLKASNQPPELFYWLRDKGIQKGEVDFLIEKDKAILPIEVKSVASGHLKSLFYFVKEKNKSNALKLSIEEFSQQKIKNKIQEQIVECHLTVLPIWAVESIPKLHFLK